MAVVVTFLSLSLCSKFKNWLRKYVYRHHMRSMFSSANADPGDVGMNNASPGLKRWEADYQLEEIDRLHLFDEYIEMSKQT